MWGTAKAAAILQFVGAMTRKPSPVDREHRPLPPGPRSPQPSRVPVAEPPPPPRNQPDGSGEPDEVDDGDVEKDPAIDEPARDGNDFPLPTRSS
jgi:hypothetical protein